MRTACPWPWKLSNNRLAQGGAVFGGGKGGGGGTTYQTQSTTIPPEVRARYDAVNARAEQVAQQPFTPYGGQFVAPLNPTQLAAMGQIGEASTAYQPYYQAAGQALGEGSNYAMQQYGGAGQNIQGALATGAPYLGAATQALGQAQAQAQPYLNAATGYGAGAAGQAAPYYGAATQQVGAGLAAAQPFYNAAQNQFQSAQQAAAPYMGAVNEQVRQAQQAADPYNLAARGAFAQAQSAAQPYMAAAGQALSGAQGAANPLYSAAQAGLGQAQMQGQPYIAGATEAIRQAQAAGQPYLGTAAGAAQQGSQAVNAGALQTQAYMNPFVQSVVDPTMAALRQQQQAEQSQLMGAQAARGAFGGDRGAIAAANLARQQELGAAQTQAGLLSQGYQQALQAAQQQQGVNLAAEQANRAAQQQYANQALQIGQQAFAQPAAAAAALQNIGQQAFQQPFSIAQQQQAMGQNAYAQALQMAGAQQALGQQAYAQPLGAGQALQGLGQQVYQQPMGAAGVYGQQAGMAFQQPMATGQALQGLGTLAFQNPLAASQAYQGLGGAMFQQPMAQAALMGQLGQQAFQQPLAASQQYGALGQQGYGQLMGAAQQQQALGQNYMGYGTGTAQMLQGLGSGAQQAGLAGGQALLGAGTMGQQTQQQLNSALYNQYLQQQGYPFQVAQFLANIALGTGPLYGSTTSGVTTAPGSFFGGSDRRIKKNVTEIGKTHDKQPIYKFNYDNEPDDQRHIGLMAQDVEKKHPEAVRETPEGIKMVSYDLATKNAERAEHAYGGGLLPSSEGGAVLPNGAYQGFAGGGVPVPGSNPLADDMVKGLAPKMPRPAFATDGSVDAELLRKLFPWNAAGMPGKGAGWAPGLLVKPQAPLGSGTKLPTVQQQPSGLSQLYSAAKGGMGAIEDAEKMAKAGTKAYDWAKGAIGDIKDKLELPGLTKQAEDYAATGTEMNPTMAHGGRAGYAEGGDTDENPAIPYESGVETDDPLKKLTAKQVTPAKLPEHNLGAPGGGSRGGGGSGLFGDIGAGLGAASSAANIITKIPAILAMFANGGAADYTRIVERGESGGKNIRNPLSGAEGEFQFMPATWAAARKALPHLPSNIRDSSREQRLEAMNWLTGENRRALSSSLGRAPSDAELRYAHYFGPSGAAALMKLEPGTRFADLPSDFWHKLGERFDTATLLRQNPNLRDETVGGLLNKYRGEFGERLGAAMPAERVIEKRPPVAGLAPHVTDVEDLNEEPMGLAPVDLGKDFELPERFHKFDRFDRARGGLAPRRGYQDGGEPELPPYDPRMSPDAMPYDLAPDVRRYLEREIRQAPLARPGETAERYMPSRQQTTVGANPPVYPPEITQGAPPAADAMEPETRKALLAEIAARQTPAAPTGVAPPLPAPVTIKPAPGEGRPSVEPSTQPPPNAPSTMPPSALPAPDQPDFLDRTGKWLGRNQDWLLALTGGVGKMLSSRSPYFLPALGEGLVEGASMYPALQFKQKGLDIQQQQADIAGARQLFQVYSDLGTRIASGESTGMKSSELAPLKAQYDYLGKQINSLIGKYVKSPQQAAEILGGAAPSVGGATPAVVSAGEPAGGATPAGLPGAQPPANQSDVPAWARRAQTSEQDKAFIKQNIDPNQDPDVLRERARRAAATNSRVAQELMAQADAVQSRITQRGEVPQVGGGFTTLPGWNERRSEVERTDQNTKWQEKYGANQQAIASTLTNINELNRALQNVTSGPAAGKINDIAALVEQLSGGKIKTDLAAPDAYFTARKNAYNLVFSRLAAAGAPSDERLRGMIAGSADPNLPPDTNKAIMAELKAMAEWTRDRDNFVNGAINKYGPQIRTAEALQEWGSDPNNDLIERTAKEKKNIAVLGDMNGLTDRRGVPIPSKLTVGQMYMVPIAGGGYRRARYIGPDENGGAKWSER